MPSNGLINYPFCATQALHTFPSPEWNQVSRVWKRTGSPPNEQSLFSETENTAEWLFVSPLVLCLLPYLLSLPKTIIKSRRVSLDTMAFHMEGFGKMLSLLQYNAYGGHPK